MAPPKASPQGRDLQDILANMAQLAMGTEKRTGQAPPKTDPAQIRSMHAQAYRNSKDERTTYAGHHSARQTFCGDIYCSKLPLDQLTRIGIKNLKMEIKHEGKYLLLRLIEPCFRMSGIMTVVEDPEGSVCILSLYNYIEKDSVNVEELLPVGTILALKEPHYKFTNSNSCVIRCDSPSDVIILERTGRNNGLDLENLIYAETHLKGVTWKTKLITNSKAYSLKHVNLSNSVDEQELAFNEERYHDAISIAARAKMTHYNDEIPVRLHVYRALALLPLGQYEKAFSEAISVFMEEEGNVAGLTALLPMGRALYNLRRFEDSFKVYKVIFDRYEAANLPQEAPVSYYYESSKKRIQEAKEGKYDLGAMMAKVKASKAPRLDNADYIGPVKLAPLTTGSKGIKVVVSKEVEPGTLLMACKAFEIVYQSELKDSASAFMLINFKNNIISLPARSQLVTKIAMRILENPSMAVGLYDLETRDKSSNELVKLYADDINQREPIADVDLIHRIVAHNALNPESLDETMLGYRKQATDKPNDPDAGLWILPSHIKHACCPSAVATFIGDFMFVRAKQHMKPGDEVTISYIEAVASLADRSAELSTRNFSCYCSLCETEREEPKSSATKRANILADFGKKFKLGQSDDLTVINTIISGIKETYEPSAKIQQMLYLPYTALGAVYLSRDQRKKAAEAFTMALRSLGFTQAHEEYVLKGTGIFPRDIILPLAPMTAIHVYNYYWHADEYDLAEKWFRIAKGLDKILHGGDESVFRALYNTFLNVM